MILGINIVLTILGIASLVFGIFREKTRLGKFFIALGIISTLGFGYLGYEAAYVATSKINSISAQATITIRYGEDKFRDISILQNGDNSASVIVDGNQTSTETLPSLQASSTKYMYIEFGKDQTPIVIVPSNKENIQEDTIDERDVGIIAQFDLSDNPQVSQLNGNLEDLEQSQWIQFNIPDPFAGTTFTEGGVTEDGNVTNTVMVGGNINLLINGDEKATLKIPVQYILPIQNSLLRIPITFPPISSW